MRKVAASPSPTTKVPMPCRVATRPAACSREIASRTTVRLTPNSCMIAASVGSFSPGGNEPSRMRPASASTTIVRETAGAPARDFDHRVEPSRLLDRPV